MQSSFSVLTAGLWFSSGTPVFSTNKTDRHDITEILLNVALNAIILTLTLTKLYEKGVKIAYHIFISNNVNFAHTKTPQCHSDISPWAAIGAKF
jgi:hypothetical protein